MKKVQLPFSHNYFMPVVIGLRPLVAANQVVGFNCQRLYYYAIMSCRNVISVLCINSIDRLFLFLVNFSVNWQKPRHYQNCQHV